MQLIAGNISNLTDARYFAAMGADWIGFRVNPADGITVQLIHTIIDWVEGPQIFLDVRDCTRQDIETFIKEFEPSGLLVSNQDDLTGDFKGRLIVAGSMTDTPARSGTSGEIIFIEKPATGDWGELAGYEGPREFWISIDSGKEELNKIKGPLPENIGIVLSGSGEEQTGLKEYDEIDDIIEFLRS